MRTLDEARSQFAYHPATGESAARHAQVRDLFRDTLEHLWAAVPDGPEKTLAVRKLQEAQMYANLAIALTVPADTSETRGVARVLPAAATAAATAAEDAAVAAWVTAEAQADAVPEDFPEPWDAATIGHITGGQS